MKRSKSMRETNEIHVLRNYTQANANAEIGTVKINQKQSNNGVKRCRRRLKQKLYSKSQKDERNEETCYEKTVGNININDQDSINETQSSSSQKRRKQANKQLWKKLDIRIIIGDEIYQRTRKETVNQTIKILKQDPINDEEKSPHDQQIVQNAIVFADDTKLLSENDTHEQMNERMGNYDIITETRHLKIQWEKALLLRRDKEKRRKELPPPFDKIKHQNSGTILGKTISMLGNIKNAVTDRIKKAHQKWKQINYKLLRNKAVDKKIKLMLRNSLIRSTMIYGLHTTQIPENQIKRMESSMYKNIRTMMNPKWKEEKWYPTKSELYEEIGQPTMKTWMEKTQVTMMLTQTRGKKTIHEKSCAEM